ncbi:MAG: 4-alpha-glucanotransferase [Paludibacter sp.]|nr:4-alpha-glucanotransferase [Paludibacter sp.]
MKVQFKIHYVTQWGQSVYLMLHSPAHEQSQSSQAIVMQCNASFEWTAEVNIDNSLSSITYQYALLNTDKEFDNEYGKKRIVTINPSKKDICIQDFWRGPFGDSPFITAAFSDCFFKREKTKSNTLAATDNLMLRLNCPQMEPHRHVAVIGNQAALGNWDESKKLKLDDTNFPVWQVTLDAKDFKFPLEYKYLIVDTATDKVLAWGGGPNRIINSVNQQEFTVVTDEHFLRTIPSWKGTGVAIPVFSLRSEDSFGIGEFNDLKKMVDWAKKTGQRMIQTLPINDTILYHTNYDSYPYNAVSVYALHPIYLHLDKLGKLKDKKLKVYFDAQKKELNEKTFSDYENVIKVKWEFFKAIFPQESPAVFASDDYKNFFETNKEWLVPYAAFSYLRDLNGTPEFGKWPTYSLYNKADIEAFSAPTTEHYPEIALFYFLQYHLHKQLVEVHDYARANGIGFKGDIPIGVSPRSVDAWVDPELFNANGQAGAPPDDFSVTGQNWGFPTYNWELMEKDGYQWWRKRFQKLAEYFDAYRIDHILGFFRIWEIPADAVWGLTGSFHPALPFSGSDLESRGLRWDQDRFVKPYLKEHVLYATFGKYTDEVIRKYFVPDGWQQFKFKPEFDTQKKIETHFATLGYNFRKEEILIRDGLYAMHCEVLFVRDMRQPEKFHPRISMHSSAGFRDLPEATRRLLDKIYIDYFYHRHTQFWKQQAMTKLPALISATNMLVCGEDLGMVPDSVPDVMNALEILSLEIQRMPKKVNTEFAMPADAPYRSVCTTSTHDMNPIRAWWEEDAVLTQRFYNRALGMQGTAPETCEQWIAEKIIEQHLQSQAMWIILPWQDWMALETKLCHEHPNAERINVPSNPRNFWCYRMHMTLEQLLKEDDFNSKIKEMITESGR